MIKKSPLFLKYLLRIVPMTFVMGTIFILSHQSGDFFHLPGIIAVDKIGHLTIYGLLALSVLWALSPAGKGNRFFFACLTLFVCFFYGLSDEFHQSFIPGRFPSSMDLLADTLGAALVIMIWLYWNKSRLFLAELYYMLQKEDKDGKR